MVVNDLISAVSDRWFLSEPLLFATLCSHRVVENRDMACALRSGKLRIEYNPDLLAGLSDMMIEILLRREVIRILLKHPYQRQPLNAQPELLTLASDVTLYQHGCLGINPLSDTGISLPEKLSFEEYYNLLSHLLEQQCDTGGDGHSMENGGLNIGGGAGEGSDSKPDEGGDSEGEDSESGSSENGCSEGGCSEGGCSEGEDSEGEDSEGKSKKDDTTSSDECTQPSQGSQSSSNLQQILDKSKADASALWEEDAFIEEKMNRLIENAMVTNQWGSIPGDMKGLLKVSMEKSLNVRRQLGLFKASILSTQRRLTRMRPNRRYGWEQMGVIHPYTTRLLIAVDTSGSVSDADLKRFFSIVNSFFSYGIPQIDVLQFDAAIHLPLLSIKKVSKSVKVTGRGGTCFQPPIDFFDEHKEYDGMIIFTDGYAPDPKMPVGRRILWALKDRECYNDCKLAPKIYI